MASSRDAAVMTNRLLAVDRLRRHFTGDLVLPRSADYDRARRVWNGDIDRRPAVIARCNGVGDVTAALRFARDKDLRVAVRGGGHNVAGLSTCDGGIVIDLGPMKGVRVDPVARTATAGPGVLWQEFDRETQGFGLATPGGAISDTGIGGLTLGGGIGHLSRRFGLTSDNLLAADLVTADGRLVRVTETEHPDLLWGLRGGGGNFGIVTSFTYRLHELAGPVLAGPMIYPAEHAAELIRFVREWMPIAPAELSVMVMLVTAPPAPFVPADLQGRRAVMVNIAWSGALDDGERVLALLRCVPRPGRRPGGADAVHGSPADDRRHGGARAAVLPQGAVPARARRRRSGERAARPPDRHVAAERDRSRLYARRDQCCARRPHRVRPPGGVVAVRHHRLLGLAGGRRRPARRLGEAAAARARPGLTGSYVNHLGGDEIDDEHGYVGVQRARLAALKARWDPENVFRLNPNVRPAVAA